jgi:hypothetical protein
MFGGGRGQFGSKIQNTKNHSNYKSFSNIKIWLSENMCSFTIYVTHPSYTNIELCKQGREREKGDKKQGWQMNSNENTLFHHVFMNSKKLQGEFCKRHTANRGRATLDKKRERKGRKRLL